MEAITIQATPRTAGKREVKAVRYAGNVPCVLYGRHVEPVAFQVPESALKPLIYTSELHVVQLQMEDQSWECVMKEVVFDPVTDRPVHADFLALQRGEPVNVTVPVQVHGQAPGVRDGGDLQVIAHELAIRCLPKDIPAHIDVHIDALGIGDAILVGDLSVTGVEFLAAPDQMVVSIVAPRVAEAEEAAAPEAEAEAGEASDEAEA